LLCLDKPRRLYLLFRFVSLCWVRGSSLCWFRGSSLCQVRGFSQWFRDVWKIFNQGCLENHQSGMFGKSSISLIRFKSVQGFLKAFNAKISDKSVSTQGFSW